MTAAASAAVGDFISHRLLVVEGQHGAERLFEVAAVCCESRTLHCGHRPQCFTATASADTVEMLHLPTVAVFHKLGVMLQLDSKQIVANSNQIFAVSKQI